MSTKIKINVRLKTPPPPEPPKRIIMLSESEWVELGAKLNHIYDLVLDTKALFVRKTPPSGTRGLNSMIRHLSDLRHYLDSEINKVFPEDQKFGNNLMTISEVFYNNHRPRSPEYETITFTDYTGTDVTMPWCFRYSRKHIKAKSQYTDMISNRIYYLKEDLQTIKDTMTCFEDLSDWFYNNIEKFRINQKTQLTKHADALKKHSINLGLINSQMYQIDCKYTLGEK